MESVVTNTAATVLDRAASSGDTFTAVIIGVLLLIVGAVIALYTDGKAANKILLDMVGQVTEALSKATHEMSELRGRIEQQAAEAQKGRDDLKELLRDLRPPRERRP